MAVEITKAVWNPNYNAQEELYDQRFYGAWYTYGYLLTESWYNQEVLNSQRDILLFSAKYGK